MWRRGRGVVDSGPGAGRLHRGAATHAEEGRSVPPDGRAARARDRDCRDQLRQLHDRPRQPACPENRLVIRLPGAPGRLRRHPLPPNRPRVRDPRRRPDGHWKRWARVLRRRAAPAQPLLHQGNRRHGQDRGGASRPLGEPVLRRHGAGCRSDARLRARREGQRRLRHGAADRATRDSKRHTEGAGGDPARDDPGSLMVAEPRDKLESRPVRVGSEGVRLAGEEVGEGWPIVLLHGLTATRRYVLHGSVTLARRGYRLISYDARGHGESSPAPDGQGYWYPELTRDLAGVLADRCPGEPSVLCGHSMGCHTAVAFALDHPDEVAALVLGGPVTLGIPATDEVLAGWDRLADGLERGGVEGFMEAYEDDLSVAASWHETALRITRERMERHRHPEAVARALREVPRSVAFDGLAELETLDVPALVVASYDEADPGHPYAMAEAWAERLPDARLVSEEPGRSPLAWQGGRLSRVISDFLDEPRARERLG